MMGSSTSGEGAVTDQTGAVQQLSPSLYRVQDACNVYLIRRGERAILIDSGLGLATEALEGLGVRQVDWVLHTHFHRDQCAGTAALVGRGARVAVPRAELGYFAGADAFWRSRGIFDNYNTYNDFFAPTASIAVDQPLDDYGRFVWQGLELSIVPAPGHTKGQVALVGEVDGRRVAFVGDAVHHSARPWTLYDLEWSYGQQTGLQSLAHTLDTLAGMAIDQLLPSHGEPIDRPAEVCRALNRKLSAYYQWLNLYRYPAYPWYPPLPSDSRLQPLTPHLWVNSTSVANSYTLVEDDGAAMFLDYGFPSGSHFSANFRFAEHSLDELRRVAGLKTVEVVLPSHYHDDHVGGLQHLHERHGAKLWVFENQADILANPHAYKIPCLWERPMAPSKIFAEGETFAWRSTRFTATKTPGHTEYHCALRFESDGRRIAYVGDTLARALNGPRFGGPVFQNRFAPGDFVESVTKIRDFEPELILTGHFGAQRVEPAFFDEALTRARSLENIVNGLVAVPAEAGFALDPNWATLYPYQATVAAGQTIPLEVRIVNHLDRPTVARAAARLPVDWTCEPASESADIAAGATGVLRFRIAAPPYAKPGARHVISAEVTLGERRFGPVAEGIVRVVGV
jgi:glyoxylase-like metal-dependent hydrolase (beta-lactamase superfamily II)